MGRATDKDDEFPPSHGAYPKAKDRDLIITPRIAARSGQLCPLRVSSAAVDQREVVQHVRFCSDCRHDDAQQRNDAMCQ
jgi:hypothetical protein